MTREGAVGRRQVEARSADSAREDARLIVRIAEGDRRAFEDLYRRYHLRLTRFIMNLIHRPHIAEEVLNDTLMVVWKRAGAYDGASKVSTWIFAIAYRRTLSAMRGHREPMEDPAVDTRACPADDPEQRLGKNQTRQLLIEAMRALSPDHRTVVDLTYFHELGYREIAEIMSCPVDTVKTRMYHARRHLKRVLAEQFTDCL
jgi:RNA polymerase sigma-70 factor (ECF subfamily)